MLSLILLKTLIWIFYSITYSFNIFNVTKIHFLQKLKTKKIFFFPKFEKYTFNILIDITAISTSDSSSFKHTVTLICWNWIWFIEIPTIARTNEQTMMSWCQSVISSVGISSSNQLHPKHKRESSMWICIVVISLQMARYCSRWSICIHYYRRS